MSTLTLPKPTTQTAIPAISNSRLLQASGEFQYRFDDLGIEIECGFSAGAFNGTANITYWNDEDGLSWFVGDILLDCSKWNGKSWDAQTIKIEQDSKLYIPLWSELTDGALHDAIDAAVRGKL